MKWAGGKRQLLDHIRARMPREYGAYFEPFAGGGALFFALTPERAHLNDINPVLMGLYQNVRDHCERFIEEVNRYDAALAAARKDGLEQASSAYYVARARFNELVATDTSDVEASALLVFLNKHCYNGLYRVNKSGHFNVPYNGSTRASINPANVRAAASALRAAVLSSVDFEEAVAEATKGDFVFFDPPYVPLNATSFTAYSAEGFELGEHQRLASVFRALDARGCHIILTNHDTPLVRELYAGYQIEAVPVRRAINRRADARHGVEVIVRNRWK